MLNTENYAKAYTEVDELLKHVKKEDVELISPEFLALIHTQKDPNYHFEYHDDLEKQEILRETKAVLAYIYLAYWATPEEKARIEQKFKFDMQQIEETKKEAFEVDVFKNKVAPKTSDSDVQLISYQKENVFTRIFRKIRNFFSKKEIHK